MSSVNKVILIGNLGADPEVRTFQNGNKVCNLRLACSENWKDKNTGERKERTEWVSVAIFTEGLVRVAEQYLKKGSKIYVEGKLQTRKWQDKDGQDRYSLNRTQYNSFNTEVVDELRPYIQDTDRILFLPAQNDFLIARIIPFTGGYTYNIFFDKEVARIRPQQPPSIVEVERNFGTGDLTAEDVRDLFDEGLVDKVIFTYFNLRWDSYWWPPAQSTVESYGTRVSSLNLTDIPKLRTHDEEFFLVVEQR